MLHAVEGRGALADAAQLVGLARRIPAEDVAADRRGGLRLAHQLGVTPRPLHQLPVLRDVADDADETNIAKLVKGMIEEHLTMLADIEKHLG